MLTMRRARVKLPPEDRLIDVFMPVADVVERHETFVPAPAEIVYSVAQNIDLQSNPIVRGIFRLRAWLMRAHEAGRVRPRGLVAETRALGWGVLGERAGRQLVMGAVTQPWKGDVRFRGISPERFLRFDEPDLVKIVWTLEVDPVGPALTRFRSETRVLATDRHARRRFRRYWRRARPGILLIRRLVLSSIRRESVRQRRARRAQQA